MAGRDISRLCQSVLPAEFEQVRRQLPQIQRFLEENLPDAVKHSVTVLAVNAEEIVIAANTPMVANYLRLHSPEIQQQLRETFQLQQPLKFRSIPDDLLKPRAKVALPSARKVSEESVAAIRLNAGWIENDDLRAALLSLADSLGPGQGES